jgi:hypothetical protein
MQVHREPVGNTPPIWTHLNLGPLTCERAQIAYTLNKIEDDPRRLGDKLTNYIRKINLLFTLHPVQGQGPLNVFPGQIKIAVFQDRNDKDTSNRGKDEFEQKSLRKFLGLLEELDARKYLNLTINVKLKHVRDWPDICGENVTQSIINGAGMQFRFVGIFRGSDKNNIQIELSAYRKTAPESYDKEARVTITLSQDDKSETISPQEGFPQIRRSEASN